MIEDTTQSNDHLKSLEMKPDALPVELESKERSKRSRQQIASEIIEARSIQTDAANP
jgi:hypothetical protein